MSLNVTLDLPADLEERLLRESENLEVEVRTAYALELFRQGKLGHYDLSRVLGLDRFQTSGLLKQHHIYEGSLTMEDLEADRRTLDAIFPEDS